MIDLFLRLIDRCVDLLKRKRPRYNRSGTDGCSLSNLCHDDCASADPTICANRNVFEYALFGSFNASILAAAVLPPATQDLHTRSNLTAVSDARLPQHTKRADVDSMSHRSSGMCKERSHSNVTFQRPGTQRHGVIGYSQIASWKSRGEREGLGEKTQSQLRNGRTRLRQHTEGKEQGGAPADALDAVPQVGAHISFSFYRQQAKRLAIGLAEGVCRYRLVWLYGLPGSGFDDPLLGAVDQGASQFRILEDGG